MDRYVIGVVVLLAIFVGFLVHGHRTSKPRGGRTRNKDRRYMR